VDPLRNFGFLLRNVSRLYAANFERHATGLRLTLAQCRVLCYLERNEGISQAKLADQSDTDPMTLVRILDRMEADGLIERRADPADRRTRSLFLRAPALPVLKEIWRVSDRARAECFARMPVSDREVLLSLLQQMQANLEVLVAGAAEPPRAARAPAKRVSRTAVKRPARSHAVAKA
jgi:MarR family transcriptional regulator, transcriptional regulator for hemolysin